MYVTEKLVKLLYELTLKQNVRENPHNLSIPQILLIQMNRYVLSLYIKLISKIISLAQNMEIN